jgi:hypothetical protein
VCSTRQVKGSCASQNLSPLYQPFIPYALIDPGSARVAGRRISRDALPSQCGPGEPVFGRSPGQRLRHRQVTAVAVVPGQLAATGSDVARSGNVWPRLATPGNVSQHLAGLEMSGRFGNVWQVWQCLADLAISGRSGNVWQVWKCLAGLAMSGRSGNVWQVWKCLAGLEMSGRSGNVWQELGCPLASLPDRRSLRRPATPRGNGSHPGSFWPQLGPSRQAAQAFVLRIGPELFRDDCIAGTIEVGSPGAKTRPRRLNVQREIAAGMG